MNQSIILPRDRENSGKATRFIDSRFGQLTVTSVFRSGGRLMAICACDCGNIATLRTDSIRSGGTRSCGCMSRERRKKWAKELAHRNTSHGHTRNGKKTPTYGSWSDMVKRCTNSRHRYWNRYGGRGITVCDRWRDFANFLLDMGERPVGKSIDRINNDGNYEPGNCRWATCEEQVSNRNNCIYVNDGAERVTLTEFCRRHELCYQSIVRRIQNYGWSVSDALTIPVGASPPWITHAKRKSA